MPITLNHSNIGVQYSTGSNYIIETVKSDLYLRNEIYDTIVRDNIQTAPVTPSIYIENTSNIYAVESYTYTGTVNTADYTRVFPKNTVCDILIVGGGGGGGYAYVGGGGGGGGYVYLQNVLISTGSCSIKVGRGGAAGVNGASPAGWGSNGNNSSITGMINYIALGGGGGAGGSLNGTITGIGNNGGSGGGGSYRNISQSAAAGGTSTQLSTYGYGSGGSGNSYGSPWVTGGGGGGASGTTNGTSATGNNGLSNSITGTSITYAGGGGGGVDGSTPSSGGTGGGGGGANQTGTLVQAVAGTDGLGGGGGGSASGAAAKGGSGIVIIRYLVGTIPTNNLLTSEPIVISPVMTESIRTFAHSGGTESQTTHTITVGQNTICDILIVGGGGSGDRQIGGGGGGGAVLYATNITIPANTYTIKVGKGGENGNGGNSEAFGSICLGGGSTPYVAWGTPNSGTAGGSGSGASPGGTPDSTGGSVGVSTKGTLLSSGTLYNGNIGGNALKQTTSQSGAVCGGGGGGAGTAGFNSAALQYTTRSSWIAGGSPSKGGDGVAINITGTTYYWGAGGGGGSVITHGGDGGLGGGGGGGHGTSSSLVYPAGLAGTGGINSGGNGLNTGTENGGNGAPNTGSGGGGGGYNGGGGAYNGGNGGSGIVIIKFKTIVGAGILDGITHKRLNFAYIPSTITYDFTPYNTDATWKAYATSIGATTYFNYFEASGLWHVPENGYIQLTLPGGYNMLKVNYNNPHVAGTIVNIYIDNVLKDTCQAGLSREYIQSYTTGQILRIEEVGAIIGKNLIITLTNTNSQIYTLNFPVPTIADINNNSNIVLRGAYDIALSTSNALIIPKSGQYIHSPTLLIKDGEERIYPPVRNFTTDTTIISGQPYGNGTYIVSASTFYSGEDAFRIFNGTNSGWTQVSTKYDGSPAGTYTGLLSLGGFSGEWIKVQFPVSIKLTKYIIEASATGGVNRAPSVYKIFGSNNNIDWEQVVYKSVPLVSADYISSKYEEKVSSNNYYRFFALVVGKNIGADAWLSIGEWYIYGREFVSNSLSIRYNLLNPILDPIGAQWTYNSSNTNVYHMGNVGIGTKSPEYHLDVRGSIYSSLGGYTQTGLTTWSIASDRRIKENIVKASYEKCLDNVKNIELYNFNFKDNCVNTNDKHQLGFIAQEVQQVYPKAVEVSKMILNTNETIDDLLSLNTTQIDYTLYGAVKNLIEKIEDIDNELGNIERNI